jgi:hypothetical protein
LEWVVEDKVVPVIVAISVITHHLLVRRKERERRKRRSSFAKPWYVFAILRFRKAVRSRNPLRWIDFALN